MARSVQAAGLEIKFQMIVETDVGVLCRHCRLRTDNVYVTPASSPVSNQGYICHSEWPVEGGIFLSEIFDVFSFTYQPPTSIQTIRLAELAGGFSAQWTIT